MALRIEKEIRHIDVLINNVAFFNPLYTIALRNEALRCNTYWLFLDFSIAPLWLNKKSSEAVVFAVAQR